MDISPLNPFYICLLINIFLLTAQGAGVSSRQGRYDPCSQVSSVYVYKENACVSTCIQFSIVTSELLSCLSAIDAHRCTNLAREEVHLSINHIELFAKERDFAHPS